MTIAVVYPSGNSRSVSFVALKGEEGQLIDPSECAFEPENPVPAGEKITYEECGVGPSPITPEGKELLWGAGSFVVFALLMRLFLFPRVKRGMEARYESIRTGHENADAARMAARSEVSQYDAAVVSAKADAAKVIDVARATLEAERQSAISAANSRINAKRDAALREAEAARSALRGQIESAVSEVTSSAVELATGKRPDQSAVSRAVADAMSAGVGR